ncbi:hypothetical protein [Antribacter gilvus]|uniref:hypothetical protein n=1 Tax=Antribacter gilvus TaxID=2304675 RepID=UPI0013E0C32E|nr:hypothetical protein [Antribacter gilvus]
MHRIVAGGVLITLALSGCSLVGTSEGSAPGSAATASAAALTKEEAAQRYAEMVKPYDEVRVALETAISEGRSLEEQAGLAGATAGALRAEIEGLRATTWPDDVQPLAEALAAASEQALPLWEQAAAATTPEDLATAVQSATPLGGEEATTLEGLLGLEPAS